MFEPKALYQAYNLARLQDNTFSHRRSLQGLTQYSTLIFSPTNQTKIILPKHSIEIHLPLSSLP